MQRSAAVPLRGRGGSRSRTALAPSQTTRRAPAAPNLARRPARSAAGLQQYDVAPWPAVRRMRVPLTSPSRRSKPAACACICWQPRTRTHTHAHARAAHARTSGTHLPVSEVRAHLHTHTLTHTHTHAHTHSHAQSPRYLLSRHEVFVCANLLRKERSVVAAERTRADGTHACTHTRTHARTYGRTHLPAYSHNANKQTKKQTNTQARANASGQLRWATGAK
jgi:hypothetical protein